MELPPRLELESTYIARLPGELRELLMRYARSCDYRVHLSSRRGRADQRIIFDVPRFGRVSVLVAKTLLQSNELSIEEFVQAVFAGRPAEITLYRGVEHDTTLATSSRGTVTLSSGDIWIDELPLCAELVDVLMRLQSGQ